MGLSVRRWGREATGCACAVSALRGSPGTSCTFQQQPRLSHSLSLRGNTLSQLRAQKGGGRWAGVGEVGEPRISRGPFWPSGEHHSPIQPLPIQHVTLLSRGASCKQQKQHCCCCIAGHCCPRAEKGCLGFSPRKRKCLFYREPMRDSGGYSSARHAPALSPAPAGGSAAHL
jgi:hypothetical protein